MSDPILIIWAVESTNVCVEQYRRMKRLRLGMGMLSNGRTWAVLGLLVLLGLLLSFLLVAFDLKGPVFNQRMLGSISGGSARFHVKPPKGFFGGIMLSSRSEVPEDAEIAVDIAVFSNSSDKVMMHFTRAEMVSGNWLPTPNYVLRVENRDAIELFNSGDYHLKIAVRYPAAQILRLWVVYVDDRLIKW